jgi:two-component system sensor histidine kinase KdpD
VSVSSAWKRRSVVDVREWLLWFTVLAAVTAAMYAVRARLNQAHVTLAYLLVVQIGSARGGRRLGIALAVVAFLLFDTLFLPPFGTLVIQNPLDWLVLVAFLGTGVLSAQLLHRAESEAESARRRTAEIDRLAALGAETLNAGRADDALAAIARVIRGLLPIDECAVYTIDAGAVSRRAVARDDNVPESMSASSLVGWVAREGKSAGQLTDGTTRVDVEGAALAGLLAGGGLAALVQPLQVRGQTVGVLRIENAAGLTLTPEHVRILDALSYYAALGVERVRLSAEAERAVVLLEADRAKDAVLASVSHDLRTPLTTIKGLAHEIADGGDERAAVIEEEADRLTTFVAQLLDLSRITSGTAVPDVQPNEAEDLLGAAAQRVTGRLDGHALRISVARDDALLLGRFDFSQTLRALVNLIENAAKYSPSGAPIDVAVTRDGEWLAIAVSDRGPGIPMRERDRIFEPFYRGPDHIPDAGGVGLGLAIARGIAEAQGGALSVVEREGGGATFRMLVPAIDVDELGVIPGREEIS